MSRITPPPTPAVDELLGALAPHSGESSDELSAPVVRGLQLASAEGINDRDAGRLDHAVLELMRGCASLDALLEACDLDLLTELLQRTTARLSGSSAVEPAPELRRMAWEVLDLLARPSVLRRIEPGEVESWTARIVRAIELSHLTVGPMFRRRCERHGSKVLFQMRDGDGVRTLTWRNTAARVERIARGLLALGGADEVTPIAIFSANRLEMALIDLACLTAGLLDVMIPANSTEEDLGFILDHSGASTLIVSGSEPLAQALRVQSRRPGLRVICMESGPPPNADVMTLDAVVAGSETVPRSSYLERIDATRSDDVATVMYTSGTTGKPKAIQFTHRNIVTKRFCRGIALPEIGENDVFLCFLPLCHTFGRFLEMLGCVFWGATYSFLRNTSADNLIRAMRTYRPTVFISVPKKWIQLYEAIAQRADPGTAGAEELLEATREITGGRLKWGLSAAGHLDPEIFRFMQGHGVELLSGFGMTEATGGITMTPPGDYREGSLGLALPGIELKLADDGELLIRGPYVMRGYLDPPEGERSFDEEGWLPTGDLMDRDPADHLRLIDRKKEIYKNVKGETVAPQRMENLFHDLDSVGRAFLVGDHRDYNTLLIYPNPAYEELDFSALPPDQTHEYFRSLVVSVNKFLAPFERIVDFAIIDRDLDEEAGELTTKGTPRRQTVVRNFGDTIRQLYRRADLQVGDVAITLPNWLIQTLGLTAQHIRVWDNGIRLTSSGAKLTVERHDEQTTRIGSCLYRYASGPINLGALLTTPSLWLGNEELVRFAPLSVNDRLRPGRTAEGVAWVGRAEPFVADEKHTAAISEALQRETFDLIDIDRAACALAADDEQVALEGLRLLEKIRPEDSVAGSARRILRRAALSDSVLLRRHALQALAAAETDSRFAQTLASFLAPHVDDTPLLDPTTRAALCERTLSPRKLQAFTEATRKLCRRRESSAAEIIALLEFLAAYGAGHPASFRPLRAFLVRAGIFSAHPNVRESAAVADTALIEGFRRWLGPNSMIAVDPETGQEYGWADVVVFDDSVPQGDRERLLAAIKSTPVLREATFLFSKGALIRLNDIPPGGVWIRHLGTRHGKSVYRATIQTRFQGSHDVAINVNHSLSAAQVRDEIHWLIICGDARDRSPLVEDVGGYWHEQDLWTEEFVPGETLDRAMQRIARRNEGRERLIQLWPFLAWTALSGYVDFWHRSGRRWEIADPTLSNLIAPTDDYHTGVRIVSVSARREHTGLIGMLESFMTGFIQPAQQLYPDLDGLVGWSVIFSSLLEVVGEEDGLEMLRQTLEQEGRTMEPGIHAALSEYIEMVEVRGFLPRRLFFAAKRYRRWERLSSDATLRARAATLKELYETYGLRRLAQEYPETRIRFFRETVFRECGDDLAEELDELLSGTRSGRLLGDDLIDAVADLRARLDLGPAEDYFLARISLPYLRPEDAADFVSARMGGKSQSEIVVTLEDNEGGSFRVRHALTPKEVERLHRLFVGAKLDVHFRPEHRYLVAINERTQIVGGIYYEIREDGQSAHLEKIVVAESHRRQGVADGLMKEFFNRLRSAGVQTVTTGFFRPEYFYSFGFRIEKRYAGLVKSLEEETSEPATA